MNLEPDDAARLRPLCASTEGGARAPRALVGAMLSLTSMDIDPAETLSLVALTDQESSGWAMLWVTKDSVIFGRASSGGSGWGWSSREDAATLRAWRRRISDVSRVEIVETHGRPDPAVDPTWYWRSVADVYFAETADPLRLPFDGEWAVGTTGATDRMVGNILTRLAP